MEMMVGLFLISFLLLLIFNLFPTSLFAVQQSEAKSQADTLAQSYLNREKARNFDELVVGETLETVEVDGIYMDTRVVISEVPDSDPGLLKSVKVEVTWRGRQGEKKRTHEIWVSRVRR